MGPGRDRTRDPWICRQTRICSQTRYRLRYAANGEEALPSTILAGRGLLVKMFVAFKLRSTYTF